MRRVETGEVYSGEIPLEYFKEDKFKDKNYLDASVEIVTKCLDKEKGRDHLLVVPLLF